MKTEFSSWHVGVAAEAIAAALLARCGYDVSVQYGANQPEYDLIAARGEELLKVSVKGSQDGSWGLCQSYMKPKQADHHGAIQRWLERHKARTVLCFVQFKDVPGAPSKRFLNRGAFRGIALSICFRQLELVDFGDSTTGSHVVAVKITPGFTPYRGWLRDEDAALAEILGLPSVGFLERQRARRPAPAIPKFQVPIDLHFHAPCAVIAELAIDLTAVLPHGPEVFAWPRLTRGGRAVRHVEGFVAHRPSLLAPSPVLNASGGVCHAEINRGAVAQSKIQIRLDH
jgi:Holliday junction resolvase-like predicted endonuclease